MDDYQLKIDKLVKDIDLENYTKIKASNLSGGNQKKLCIAMSLIYEPDILILDEPTSSVDP